MTAGKGVIHSEIPQQDDGVMEGFQLWLNLHSSEKMKAPWYRDFQNDQLPMLQTPEGVEVTVIAGESHGVQGAVTREITQPIYLDVHMHQGSRFEQTLPADHNAFVYVYRGEVRIGSQVVPEQRMAILENTLQADGVVIESSAAAQFILVSGKPLNEPIVQYGPFVMNSQQEIYQALADFRDGRLGEAAGSQPRPGASCRTP
jgi:redox-sensitive bicupin YhaK (pirin superfamily)